MAIYGLFVGVNRYEAPPNKVPPLYGCVNDVELISATLKSRYAIPDENCLSLTNESATKKNIIGGFQEHLAQSGSEDTAIFYFSGHGSQEKADSRLWVLESDRYNETLVCHDSRASEPYDLADKELRYLIHQLAKRGVHVVTMIDSCHSGDATRIVNDEEPDSAVRQSPPDWGSRPIDSYLFFDDPQAQNWLEDFSQMPQGVHIAISACRDDQLAKEEYADQVKYGIFTHSLCHVLRCTLEDQSYYNLIDAAGQQVKSNIALQNPQVTSTGGDLNQLFLSGGIQRPRFQMFCEQSQWFLNAGIPQGINAGAILKSVGGSQKAGAIEAQVLTPLADRSLLKISAGDVSDTHQQHAMEMIDPATSLLPISFEGDPQQINELRSQLSQSDFRFYLREDNDVPMYTLSAKSQGVELKRSDAFPLAVPAIPSPTGYYMSPEEAGLWLAVHMAKWQRSMELIYTIGSIPDGLFELVIEQLDPASQQFVKLSDEGGNFDLHYTVGETGELERPQFKLSLELNSEVNWPEDVYVSLLFLDPVTGLVKLMKNGTAEQLRGKEAKIKDGNATVTKRQRTYYQYTNDEGKTVIPGSVPEILLNAGINHTTDYLKLFVSNFPIDLYALGQPTLKTYLKQLFNTYKSIDDEDDDDFPETIYKAQTKTYTLSFHKPDTIKTLSQHVSTTLGSKVTVLPHSMAATISLDANLLDASHNIAELSIFPEQADVSGRAVSTASEQVSATNPLQIELDIRLASNENILAYAQDEDLILPLALSESAGKTSNKALLSIEALPESSAVNSRSLGGSLKIYIKKVVAEKLGQDYDGTQLAMPVFASPHSLEVAEYDDSVKNLRAAVASADRIILFIHGILGDTQQMAGAINQSVDGKILGDGYLALTFDYENLNTPIQETADELRKKLTEVGLVGEHGKSLTIIAHSMGGLVSRWMIEKDPAAPSVDQLIMLGTPNGGSPLRDVKQWALGLLTLSLNGLASTPLGGLGVSGLLKILTSIDDTLDEMDANSKTLAYLYEAPDPKVPYFMIGGDTADISRSLDSESGKVKRLLAYVANRGWGMVAEQLTDRLFKDSNDIAVAYSSMMRFAESREPHVRFYEVDCDHLSYFSNRKSIECLARLLH